MHLRLALSSMSALAAVLIGGSPVAAHAPAVVGPGIESPGTAHVLEDPTLSRALGATLDAAGEVDWYRMHLRAGDPLVVEVTAPDAAGGMATSFTVLGPGLDAPSTEEPAALSSPCSRLRSRLHPRTGMSAAFRAGVPGGLNRTGVLARPTGADVQMP